MLRQGKGYSIITGQLSLLLEPGGGKRQDEGDNWVGKKKEDPEILALKMELAAELELLAKIE